MTWPTAIVICVAIVCVSAVANNILAARPKTPARLTHPEEKP